MKKLLNKAKYLLDKNGYCQHAIYRHYYINHECCSDCFVCDSTKGDRKKNLKWAKHIINLNTWLKL